jgi:hypothetical protein
MANHWRQTNGTTEAMRGADGSGYFTGWALSAVTTLGAILLVVHFGV